MSDEEREKTPSHVRVEQEELEAIKQTVLTRLRRILVDSVDPANHLSYLRSKFVFTERDAEEISAPPSRSARAEVFLDKLSRKGSQGYDEFQNSLCRDRTQMFLLTSMTKTFELLKHKLRDFKAQQSKQRQEQQAQQQQQYKAPLQQPVLVQPLSAMQHKFSHQSPNAVQHLQQQNKKTFQHQHQQQQQIQQQQQRVVYCQQQQLRASQQQIIGGSHYHHQQRANYGQPQNYPVRQPSVGFSPPPYYQTRTVTPPQAPLSHHNHHTPPRQYSPNFHSRDPDSNGADKIETNHFIDEQGPPHEPSDTPCGQPC